MTWLGTILLAVAVGAAEIFPVSGSGHFYILEKLLGLELSAADRTACLAVLNGGAALALLIFYHRRAGEMLVHALVGLGLIRPAARRRAPSLPRRQLQLLLLASLPMLGALLLRRPRLFVENHEAALAFVCLFEAVSGALIYFAGRGARGKRDLRQMTASDGLALGCAQILSVFPGLSRSGTVLSTAFLRGMSYPTAVEQVGLMGIPVYLIAAIYRWFTAKSLGTVTVTAAQSFVGLAISALAGLFALRTLTEHAAYRKPTGFAYWCWGAALIAGILFLIAA